MFKTQILAIGKLIAYVMSLLLDFYRIYKITQNIQKYIYKLADTSDFFPIPTVHTPESCYIYKRSFICPLSLKIIIYTQLHMPKSYGPSSSV